jgi:hypothetical protein
MTKPRVAILTATFLFTFNFQPGWIVDNFWFKAEFYDNLPFRISYAAFQLIYALLVTFLVECGIRFVKRFT